MLRLVVVASMVTAAAALHCYACASYSHEEKPLCDTDYWGNTTSSERDNILTECPEDKSDFCFKSVIVGSNKNMTIRGCTSAKPGFGVSVSEGCEVKEIFGANTTVCYCSTRACNATESLQSVLAYVVILATVSRMLN